MSCETGCREVQLIQLELKEVWKEIDKIKSDTSALQTETARAEERQNALSRSFSNLQTTLDKMSDKIDKRLATIVTEIKDMSVELQNQKTRAEFTITWKEITAAGIGILALVNAIRPYIGG